MMTKELVFYSVEELKEFLKTVENGVTLHMIVEYKGGEDIAKEDDEATFYD